MRPLAVVLALCVVAASSQRASAQLCSRHRFIADSPRNGKPGWHDGTQGIGHGPAHWYVTDTRNNKSRAILWRIPVTTDLAAHVTCGPEGDPTHPGASAGVSCRYLSELGLPPAYNHFGDPDYYEFNGRGYLLVPLEGDGTVPNGLLIFRAEDDPRTTPDETLQLLAFTPIPGQGSSAWVALDDDGILYSSEFFSEGVVNRFRLDWASFQADESTAPPLEKLAEPVLLRDLNGGALEFPHVQGGEFSDDRRRLYLVNGRGAGNTDPRHGIHVFRIEQGSADECDLGGGDCFIAHRIERSHNSDDPGFSFEFHPGVNGLATAQEPEGLTYWDLDAVEGVPNVPGVRGQLHVILLDNNLDDPEVYVKHYSFEDADSDPPTVVCPAPVTAECVSPAGVPSADSQLIPFFAGVSATDFCSGVPPIGHDAPAAFPLGMTPVTFTATDDKGNAASCQATVTVVDTTPPTIAVTLSHETLWPPDHRLVPVTTQVTIGDACGFPAIQLVSITSNESDDGIADGHTVGDIRDAALGTHDTSFLLRAERSGTGRGREYTVVYRVADGNGNASTATAVVRVPHSQ